MTENAQLAHLEDQRRMYYGHTAGNEAFNATRAAKSSRSADDARLEHSSRSQAVATLNGHREFVRGNYGIEERVFGIAEVLELILSNIGDKTDLVTVKTVLLSQRVSRAFRDTITGSMKLSRLLWFAPRLAGNATALQLRHPMPILNPLLTNDSASIALNGRPIGKFSSGRVWRYWSEIRLDLAVFRSRDDTSSWQRMVAVEDSVHGVELFFECDQRSFQFKRKGVVWTADLMEKATAVVKEAKRLRIWLD